MSDVNITSNNQKGGITAQNVNTGNGDFTIKNDTKSKKNNFWKIILGIITGAAALLSIIKFFINQGG